MPCPSHTCAIHVCLRRRPEASTTTALGYQATMLFHQTKKYMEPLFVKLKRRQLVEELRAGLWMMITVRCWGVQWHWQ
jgi:hypothetical protein